MSTAAGRGEQTTKATLNCVFLSLSEGKVEKGNEKVTQNTADTTTALKEFDFGPQRHTIHFFAKNVAFSRFQNTGTRFGQEYCCRLLLSRECRRL